MIDLTDICDWKVDVLSFKTLQQIHLGSSDWSGDSDIEVIQVVKNQQVKLEPETIVMKDLTVPPPPEHLIFENEDVLEQNYVDNLDISSEDISEFLVTKTGIYTEHLIMKNTDNVPELLITEKNKCFSWSKARWCSSAKIQCSKRLTSELRD